MNINQLTPDRVIEICQGTSDLELRSVLLDFLRKKLDIEIRENDLKVCETERAGALHLRRVERSFWIFLGLLISLTVATSIIAILATVGVLDVDQQLMKWLWGAVGVETIGLAVGFLTRVLQANRSPTRAQVGKSADP